MVFDAFAPLDFFTFLFSFDLTSLFLSKGGSVAGVFEVSSSKADLESESSGRF